MDEVTDSTESTAPAEGLGDEQPESGGTEQVADTPQTVEIDGQVYTQDELRNGLMRQADYTRKTQEVAARASQLQQAEAIWQAIQEDPRGSLEALQEHFAEQLQDNDDIDPVEARLREVESFKTEQQLREQNAAVDRELDALEAEYGKVDRRAVLEHAVNLNIGNLDAAFLHLRKVDPTVDAAAKRAQAEAAALEAKRNLPPVVGASTASGSSKSDGRPINSLKDAFHAALHEAGHDSVATVPSSPFA